MIRLIAIPIMVKLSDYDAVQASSYPAYAAKMLKQQIERQAGALNMLEGLIDEGYAILTSHYATDPAGQYIAMLMYKKEGE